MKTVYKFKKGDEVVRIIPAKSLGDMIGLMGETIERGGDRSYMGEKLIFQGIANGQAYFKRTTEFELKMFGDKLLSLSLDIWDEGWAMWVNPETAFENGDTIVKSKTVSKKDIEKQLKEAIRVEDYELADKLQSKLDKIKS